MNAQTRGKIPTIVDDPIPDSVIMYLINAIYFKGSWTQRFDPALTRHAPFKLRDGGTVTSRRWCTTSRRRHAVLRGRGVTVVDLPYGGQAYAMTIVLPQSPTGMRCAVGEP